MDWAGRHLPHIHTYSLESLAGVVTVGAPINGATSSTPTANQILYYPFRLQHPITVQKLFVMNGATAAGNLDLGIYDHTGTRLISTGSTAQSGTNVLQAISVTPTQLGPGAFYFAVVFSSGTATRFRATVTDPRFLCALGAQQQASTFPLPATATFASSNAFSSVTLMGLSQLTVI